MNCRLQKIYRIGFWVIATIVFHTPFTASAGGHIVQEGAPEVATTDQLIVKYVSGLRGQALNSRVQALQEIGAAHGLAPTYLREGALGIHVISLGEKRHLPEVEQLARDLMTRDPNVAYAEPDRLMHPTFVPNDTRYSEQWHYFEAIGGINAPAAWDLATGTGVTVAVIDTGHRPHADLATNLVGGFDFISSVSVANDGNGRDSDPQDPGNGCGGPSSWHGTHVAGTIAAVSNNANGVAGVAFGSRVVSARVLGCGGGYVSDIADAIVWTSGGAVFGAPANANPARVLNLSLGGTGACGATYQNAVNSARSRNTVVVVAAGNNAQDASNFAPGNCSGVITVAATNRAGARAGYSNFGAVVEIAAPGGETSAAANGILSTLNSGFSSPGADSYAFYQGTSMATPHVTAIVALMLQRDSALTPDQVLSTIQQTARAFPSACSGCGSGIVNAYAAVSAIAPSPLPPTPATIIADDYYACPYTSVNWSAVSGATSYEAWRSLSVSFANPVRVYSGAKQTVTQSVAPRAHAYFKAKACNASGCSALSTATAHAQGFKPCP